MNTREHYSYRVYSDPNMARDFDRDRFGGPIGELIKNNQEQLVFHTLPDVQNWKVIDVGAGTGRITLPFLSRGADVTACDASAEMLEVLKQKANHPALHVLVADAHHLQFPDQTFHCAISFRMLLHVVDWQKALSELCRVSKDWLVIDFPPQHGFLLFAPLLHALKRTFKKNHQSYRIISVSKIRRELHKNGFEIFGTDSGFFLPLGIHRVIGQPGFTRAIEKFFKNIRLTALTGSPITLFARRSK